jgi:hypothetical protein
LHRKVDQIDKERATIGTMTKAWGDGPWRRVNACMLAIAVAVGLSQNRRRLRK